jgi:HlyD family secretion protein
LEVEMSKGSLGRIIPLILLLVLVVAAVIYLAVISGRQAGPLQASGTVEAVEVAVSPELAGRVIEVLAQEGDVVAAGDPLFRLDATLLAAQRQRAEAALQVAQAALRTAQASLTTARAQFEVTVNAARLQDLSARLTDWRQPTPAEFDLPVWYFDKAEDTTAAEAEVVAAEQALAAQRVNLAARLQEPEAATLRAAETRLAQAQIAYSVARDVLDRARRAVETQDLLDYAEDQMDAAETELDEAQVAYDEAAAEETAADVLQARAQVAVAQARYDAALDRLSQLRRGEQSLQVGAAQAVVAQAEAAVSQAEAVVAQAQAELHAIDTQMEKLVVRAPVSGVVISRSVEPGEVIAAGGVAMTVGELNRLTITVYLPEDRYGEIRLDDQATVTVDSFPGETFQARVTRIADQAEFTPRNVQTQEGRRTTVFAVELSVADSEGRLKPGMPADVRFGLP